MIALVDRKILTHCMTIYRWRLMHIESNSIFELVLSDFAALPHSQIVLIANKTTRMVDTMDTLSDDLIIVPFFVTDEVNTANWL